MALVRSKNSKAERATFRYLRSKKIYLQKHYKRANGTPDIALPRKKKAVFIDGDFWHGRRLHDIIRTRGEDDYWTYKILDNMSRDETVRAELISNDWKILVVWESDINRKRTKLVTLESISSFLLK